MARSKKAKTVTLADPAHHAGRLKHVGGSQNDIFNTFLANQAVNAMWLPESADRDKSFDALIGALAGISPRDELEGMIATQMVACHNAAMECYRRAMLPEQTFEGRRENLSQANKLSRTYGTLIEALNRHRGKGQQKVTVEHVNVEKGGQAIVGNVNTGGGTPQEMEDQPHAKEIAHAPEPAMRSADEERETVPIARDEERSMPDARREIAGRARR